LESPGMGRTARLRRYGGLGCRMARSARLKLSGSPRSTWLYLARPSGYTRLGYTRVSRSARLHLARSSRRTGLDRTGMTRSAGLHLAGPTSHAGLRLSGSSRGPGGCRLARQGRSHRLDPLVRRQLLNLGLLVRGQLHGGPGR
jgi:hypothetical protein